jgi:calcineurin-like phosphoesterase family protein
MTIWFTSDNHFGHKNIIKYANRPFDSVHDMDRIMVERWNEMVKPEDVVYHLGDVGLCWPKELKKILNKLNGKKCLILGNHDASALKCSECFEWIKDYHELAVPDIDSKDGINTVVLFHYAMRVWNKSHFGSYHLYGHSHGALEDLPNALSFDVGVDSHDFYPINYDEVKAIMNRKTFTPINARQQNNTSNV